MKKAEDRTYALCVSVTKSEATAEVVLLSAREMLESMMETLEDVGEAEARMKGVRVDLEEEGDLLKTVLKCTVCDRNAAAEEDEA